MSILIRTIKYIDARVQPAAEMLQFLQTCKVRNNDYFLAAKMSVTF